MVPLGSVEEKTRSGLHRMARKAAWVGVVAPLGAVEREA